jgi:hypothetical protein
MSTRKTPGAKSARDDIKRKTLRASDVAKLMKGITVIRAEAGADGALVARQAPVVSADILGFGRSGDGLLVVTIDGRKHHVKL